MMKICSGKRAEIGQGRWTTSSLVDGGREKRGSLMCQWRKLGDLVEMGDVICSLTLSRKLC